MYIVVGLSILTRTEDLKVELVIALQPYFETNL